MTNPYPICDHTDKKLDFAVLCGGQGRRMGGVNKGLIHWQSQPIILHLLEWIMAESSAHSSKPNVWLVTNNHAADYQSLAEPYQAWLNIQIIPDRFEGYLGPLAGLDAAMAASDADTIQLLPCDCPSPPLGLTARLDSLSRTKSDKAIWIPFDGKRAQPLFSQINRSLHPSLLSALEQQHLAVYRWMQQQAFIQVECADLGTFTNINQPSSLEDSA